MAWQTPKIDWTAVDGVRDTDLNRIEGNILDLYQNGTLRSATTIYIAPAGSAIGGAGGNDTTGTGTASAPFATIARALSGIPKNLNGLNVTINVASGTYSEQAEIKGFSGGSIILTGASGASCTFTKFTVDGCTCFIDNINLTTGRNGVLVTNGARLFGTGRLTCLSSTIGLTVTNGSIVSLTSLTSTAATSYAMSVDLASRANFTSLLGSSNASGLLVQGGSVVTFASNTMAATGAMYTTYGGGRVYTNAQYSVPEF